MYGKKEKLFHMKLDSIKKSYKNLWSNYL